MRRTRFLDFAVRDGLRSWPQRPPGSLPRPGIADAWLKARPTEESQGTSQPFLKVPGSGQLRTLPDGLFLNFGGTFGEPFVDILAIEACASIANWLDKRARFAPSTQSTLAICPLTWLLAPVSPQDPTPRWRHTGVLRYRPTAQFVVPVRDVRVVYGLRPTHYDGFIRNQAPLSHEYFVPLSVLTEQDSAANPLLRGLFAHACVGANFIQGAAWAE
jgi:hypothetical protein